MEMEMSGDAVTLKVAEPRRVRALAVIVVFPAWPPTATPEALMSATEAAEELQLTEAVKFLELPSLYFPVAVNCWVLPFMIWALVGVTVMAVSEGVMGGVVDEELFWPLPPQPTKVTKVPITNQRHAARRLTDASIERSGGKQRGLLGSP